MKPSYLKTRLLGFYFFAKGNGTTDFTFLQVLAPKFQINFKMRVFCTVERRNCHPDGG